MDMIAKDHAIQTQGTLKKGVKWGVDIKPVSSSTMAIYQVEVKKGDCFMLSNKHELRYFKGEQRLYLFDRNGEYVTGMYMNMIYSEGGVYEFPQDGFMVVDFDYTNLQSGEFFYIKRPHKKEPFVLYADKAESYVDDAETGEATMKAIMEGRQILVRVPNADGGKYMALYSPILMYQLPNYLARHLYLFYLNDGVNAQGLPSYNQLKIAVSRDYNQTPLK